MMSRKKLFSVNTKPDHPFYQNTDRKPFMTDLSHVSHKEQKLLADIALLFLKITANNLTMQC